MKCFEVELDVLTFQMSEVLFIFFGLRVSENVLLALSPRGTLSSDAYYTFFCLVMFLFQN